MLNVSIALAMSLAMAACSSPGSSTSSSVLSPRQTEEETDEPSTKEEVLDQMMTSAGALILVCEDYLDGQYDLTLAQSLAESFDEELEELNDKANELGTYNSITLYSGQIEALFISWEKTQAVEDDPRILVAATWPIPPRYFYRISLNSETPAEGTMHTVRASSMSILPIRASSSQ